MTTYTTEDFDYSLPESLIAQVPLPNRVASQLLCVDLSQAENSHKKFNEIIELIKPEDLLVINNTRVIPARLFGCKETGGRVECLVERVLSDRGFIAHLKSSKSPKPGRRIRFADAFTVTMVARHDDLFELELEDEGSIYEKLHQYGEIPLPLYITRKPNQEDSERYQTVYAEKLGAVAAPTAGLHFDETILQKLRDQGTSIEKITLHVGAGTFQPVRVQKIDQHVMHKEFIEVNERVCEAVKACHERGGRVIAVGTTVVRALESASQSGEIKPFSGDTNLFIYPGYQFYCVDALLTNFHLPKSSLLMLVSAFAGYDRMMQAYREAVERCYRFFSYGDAMFISK